MHKFHAAIVHIFALTMVHTVWMHSVSATLDETLITFLEVGYKVVH